MKYNIDSIIFDFDGVILESNHVRTEGFKLLLENRNYDINMVSEFIRFHESNGGLSRYYKLKYFFNEILKEDISDAFLHELCVEYSALVKQKVANCEWVEGAEEFLKNNYRTFKFFVISGSDQNELQEICRKRNIVQYFQGILGSPTDKKTHVKNLFANYHLDTNRSLFIGDSINDFEAAKSVGINFIARDSGGGCKWHQGLVKIKNLLYLSDYISVVKES